MNRCLLYALGIAAFCASFGAPLRAAPPQPGEIERYKRDGSYEQRLEFQKSLGNDKYDPALIERAKWKIRKAALEAQGVDQATIEKMAPAPPPNWRGMPSTGDVNVPAILIEFSDMQPAAVNTRTYVDNSLWGDGVPANFPYESVTNYYSRASFGNLNLTGNTLGWYRTAYPRANVPMTAAGREGLISEALDAFDSAGHNFAQYDNDNDGDIDYLLVVYAGPNNGWGNFWWAYQTSWFADPAYRIDGKRISRYVFQFTDYNDQGPFRPLVVIHETGHALGLPDLYDYDPAVGPGGGVGGLDIMDGNWGDHNGYHKWLLEWSSPKVVGVGAKDLTLRPASISGDGAIAFKGASAANPFDEFFFIENRTAGGGGNDSGTWPGNGLMIWHVDGHLDASGNDYAWDNSFTAHKFLRLMEADGLEEIEAGGGGDGGDFWKPGQVFDDASTPASTGYDGLPSAVSVTNIRNVSGGIAAFVSVDDVAPNLITASIDKTGRKLTVVFDESVVPVRDPILDFTAGPITATYSKGADTNALEYRLSRRAFTSETGVLRYLQRSVVDPTGNELAEIRDVPVVIGVEPDSTKPVVKSATINADGDELTLVFDENVDFHQGPVLGLSGGPCTAKFKSGDGTRAWRFSLSRVVLAKETGVYDLEAGSAVNEVGLPNKAIRSEALKNDSDVKQDVNGGSKSEKRNLGTFANVYVDYAYDTAGGFYGDPSGYTGDAYYAYVYDYFALYYSYLAGDSIRWGGKTKKTRAKALADYLEFRNYQMQMSSYAQYYSQSDYAMTGSGTSLYAYYFAYYANAYAQQDMAQK